LSFDAVAYDSAMDLRASLVPADYVDPAVYAAEAERVLRASWLPVCRADQIPEVGDRFAVTLCDRPVIAVRTAGGEVQVVANVCAHRGSRLVYDGPGNDSTLVCPYHRWAYRLDGSLIGAPLAEGADLDGACLPRVRHVIWQGFVLANLSGDARDPFDDLAGLHEHVAPWHWNQLVTVASRTFPSEWNWKVMVDNWIECYHHLGTHHGSVEPFHPARDTKIVANEGAPWVAMTVEGVDGVAGEPAEWIPGLDAERARDLSVWAAFPLLLGGSTARHAFWLQVLPIDAKRHTVTWHLLAHPDQVAGLTPDFVEQEMQLLVDVHREDMVACRRVQEGLESGLIDRFRLTPLESTIADFQRWVRATGNSR
jgi:phenylpropionate dioxygenase-like ring-hydroxylating dioxygenase large terminal subunit